MKALKLQHSLIVCSALYVVRAEDKRPVTSEHIAWSGWSFSGGLGGCTWYERELIFMKALKLQHSLIVCSALNVVRAERAGFEVDGFAASSKEKTPL